jgi:hypothetical protein
MDDYRFTLHQEANQGLYCQPILAEDLIKPGHQMTVFRVRHGRARCRFNALPDAL